MAQRRRIENPVVDISNDEALDFFFQKAAGELTKLYSLALDRQVAFSAGTRYAYMRVYEWIQLQLQDGKSVTAADLSAYLEDMQQQVEQPANKVLLEDNMHNAQQLPEQLDNGTQTEASGNTNENASSSQVLEMEINY